MRNSADADFRLMRDRANSIKNLASSIDRELENFINSASAFSAPVIKSSPADIGFVKRLQPKLSEFRMVYSSPELSRKVLEKWAPTKPRIRIDLSAIRNAIVEEVAEGGERVTVVKGRRVRFKDFKWDWKGEGEGEEGFKDWEPIRALKTRLKELKLKKSPDEVFGRWKNSELVEKLKASLVSLVLQTFKFHCFIRAVSKLLLLTAPIFGIQSSR